MKMTPMVPRLAVWIALLAVCVGASAQEDPVVESRALYQQAIAAYQEQDFQGFLDHMRSASDLRPNHPTLTYNTAVGYALTGQPDEAVSLLNRVAAMGIALDPEADADFAALSGNEAFAAVVRRFGANRTPVGNSEVAFTLPDSTFFPEGLAYEPETDAFFVGSVRKGTIVKVMEGRVTQFVTSEENPWGVFGLAVDSERGLLWACRAGIEQTEGLEDADLGRTGVFAYDLSTGERNQAHTLGNETDPHHFGDLALGPDGNVYVTDTRAAALYVLPRASDSLMPFIEEGPFASPQGLAFSGDGHTLFVADYSKGIFRIDVLTRAVDLLDYPEDATVLGIDGLYYLDGSLLAVQNGVRPLRVVRFELNEAEDRLTSWSVIEANNPHFGEPTLGVLAGSRFYYVANSPWGAFNPDGTLRDGAALRPPVILKTEL